MRADVGIRTEDGVCAATLHSPPNDGSHPAVILYPDAAGVRETFSAMADRLAGLGYAVLLPDVYYRTPFEPFDVTTVFNDPGERNGSEPSPRACRPRCPCVTRARSSSSSPAARRCPVPRWAPPGTAWAAAPRCSWRGTTRTGSPRPPRSTAGTSPPTTRTARTCWPAGSAPLCSWRPPRTTTSSRPRAFVDAGVRHTIETYPAAHRFAVPDNPTYDPAAAERHWAALADLYAGALRA